MPSGKILVVDDEPAVLRAHRRMLESQGFDVLCADSGEQALGLVRDERGLDLVLSDIAMPGMRGTELLRKVRVENLDLPVVLLTGAPALETAIEAVELGALRYLTKPVALKQLVEVVSYGVRLHKLARIKREAIDLTNEGQRFGGDRAALESIFAQGIERMWLALQPIVHWPERRIFGYEALLRTDVDQIPHPGVFLDIAERLGQVHELSRVVRRTAAGLIGSLPDDALLFVNLHPADLLDAELFASDSPLSAHGGRVVLEITERASLDRFVDVRDRVTRLKQRGFRIAVDDLGAGYAGLTSLATLEPEVAKVDMSLVRDIDRNATKVKLVRSLAEVCQDLSMRVVVEGIETAAERDTLAGIGCELMQGFFFSRPEREAPRALKALEEA